MEQSALPVVEQPHAAIPRGPSSGKAPLLVFEGVSKSFGNIHAVRSVDLVIGTGERIAILGHNGAGKSTLMNLIGGALRSTSGRLLYRGVDHGPGWSIRTARRLGIRFAHQEFALADNLTVFENLRLQDRGLRGFGWKPRARKLIRTTLDEIFPENGVSETAAVSDLSVSARQMVEVARAFAPSADEVSLVVLDEPTSSLDNASADALLRYISRATAARGITTIFISHKLREIAAAADRVVVLKDGAVLADRPVGSLDRDGLVSLMDGGDTQRPGFAGSHVTNAMATGPKIVTVKAGDGGPVIRTRPGEIIGFGGLDGHGQREMLQRIYKRKPAAGETIAAPADVGFVSGDRAREGNFAFWSIAKNLSVRSLSKVARFGMISHSTEAALVDEWLGRLSVRFGSKEALMSSLSGGNQQKILIARALSSDAPLILLDDPTRGVDQKTKTEFYQILQTEAARGRCFIWYATEFEELELCDRTYVFYLNKITDEIERSGLTETRVLRSSFAETEVSP